MNSKRRNTIILLIQNLLIIGVGVYFMQFHYPAKTKSLHEENAYLDSIITLIPERESYLNSVKQEIANSKSVVSTVDKKIVPEVKMSETVSYLSQVLSRYPSTKMNIEFMKDVKADGYGFKSFSIDGEGIFQAVMYLIWLLEKGPKIIAIESMDLIGIEEVRGEDHPRMGGVPYITVNFRIVIKELYVSAENIPETQNVVPVRAQIPRGINLFLPRVYKSLPANLDNLVEVEKCRLQAILPNSIILLDQSGQKHILKKHDRVYLGYLYDINRAMNSVLFRLNKGGIIEMVELKISFSMLE